MSITMNELSRLFAIKGLVFYGTEKDLQDYNNHIGNATVSETNIREIITTFENQSKDKHVSFIVCRLGESHTLALYHNDNNNYSSYVMIYNFKTDRRLYTVNIDDVPNSFNNDIVNRIVKLMPQMCKFHELMLTNSDTRDIWMFEDLQKFADAIDKYNIEYE